MLLFLSVNLFSHDSSRLFMQVILDTCRKQIRAAPFLSIYGMPALIQSETFNYH